MSMKEKLRKTHAEKAFVSLSGIVETLRLQAKQEFD
jgi:hypothetical protein